MKLQAQYQWTDYLNAQLLHLQVSGWRRIALYFTLVALGCTMIGSIILAFTDDFSLQFIWPFILILALLPLYRYVLLPNRIKKLYFQQKTLQVPVEIEITDSALTIKSEFGYGTHPWGNFIKWKENKELFLIYHSDVLFNMLPKRIFSDPQQIETVRSYLQTKMPKEKNRFPVAAVVYFILIVIIVAVTYISFRNSFLP